MPTVAELKTARALQVVARALGRLGRERARAGDVTPQQAEALQLIAERGAMSTSTLALMLGIDPSTASRNLAGLERAGYIVRKRGADDGRQTDVRLTPRGKRTAEAVSTEWTARLLDAARSHPAGRAPARSPTRSMRSRACWTATAPSLLVAPLALLLLLRLHRRPACSSVALRRFACVARPPLRPATRASSLVNSCAVPAEWAALPPLRAISLTSLRSIAANPRGRFGLASPPSTRLRRTIGRELVLLVRLGLRLAAVHLRVLFVCRRGLRPDDSRAHDASTSPGLSVEMMLDKLI